MKSHNPAAISTRRPTEKQDIVHHEGGARPVSTIKNASAWSLAARMLRPRPFCARSPVICLRFVVPEVDTTVLP